MEYLDENKPVNQIQPVVSICVQTYQHSKYIRDCLNGILLQQTGFSYEIVLGEDESTDGTREICREYAERHPDKIRLFLRSRKYVIYINGNPTGRFNFMENYKAARGKYIALCDGDDYWTDPNKLQKQVEFLEANPDFSICFHQAKVISDDGKNYYYNKYHGNTIFTTKDIIINNFIPTSSCVFRKKINQLPDWFCKIGVADWPLHILNSEYGKIFFIDGCMSVYRVHSGGLWSSMSYKEKIIRSVDLRYELDKAFAYKYHKELEKDIKEFSKKLDFNNNPKRLITSIRKFILTFISEITR